MTEFKPIKGTINIKQRKVKFKRGFFNLKFILNYNIFTNRLKIYTVRHFYY